MRLKLYRTIFLLYCISSAFNSWGQALTVREVFDAQIGDYYTYEILKHTYFSDYVFRKVTDKQLIGSDSLKVTYFEAAQVYNGNKYVRHTRTFSQIYTHLDSPYFKQFDKHDTINLYFDTALNRHIAGNGHNDSIYMDSCGNNINKRHDYSWAILSGSNEETTIAIKGVGIFYSWMDSEEILFKGIEEIPINYSVNGILCGRKTVMPLDIQNPEKKSLLVYPNPCSDFLYISNDLTCFFTIVDIHGQVIISGINDKGYIDVQLLPSGIYYVRFQNNNDIIYTCFIKN